MEDLLVTGWGPWNALQGPFAMEWVLIVSAALVLLGSSAPIVSAIQLKRRYEPLMRRLEADLAAQRARAESLNTVATFVEHSRAMRIVVGIEKQLETLREQRDQERARAVKQRQSWGLRTITTLTPLVLWWALRKFVVLDFDCRFVWPLHYLFRLGASSKPALDTMECETFSGSDACSTRCELSAFVWYSVCSQAMRGLVTHFLALQGV